MNGNVPVTGVTFYLCHNPEELYQKSRGVESCSPPPCLESISFKEERYFACGDCGRNFLTREKLKKHECEVQQDDQSSDGSSYGLKMCDPLEDYQEYDDDDDDDNEVGRTVKVETFDDSPTYVCSSGTCSKEFPDIESYEEHRKEHETQAVITSGKKRKKFPCSSCPMIFVSAEELKSHGNQHSFSPPKPHACPLCGKYFRFKVSLTRHVKSVHRNEKRFACTWCDKPFFEKSNLVKHMRVHTDDRPYSCTVCEKRFRQANSLRVHMKIHTNEDRFQCEICERSFPARTSLEKHLQRHSVAKGLKCETCLLAFPTRSTLTKHMLTHSGERAFACRVCEKRFYHKGHLTEHFRTHTGEKPFECKLCNKKFTQRTALTQHNARFHMNGKPFQCRCGESFPRKCDLKTHREAQGCS